MAKISKILDVSRQHTLHGKLAILLIFIAICVISRPAKADTSIYVFDPNQIAVVRSGGIAGLQKTFSIAGQFRLTVDPDAGVASFETVDANLIEETDLEYGQSLNEIFNMTGLAGTIIDDTTIQFEGKTAEGTESDVRLKLSFGKGLAQITGNTTPPPNSADMFIYDVNAVAIKKYAGGTGEPNNPYQIATAEDLMLLGETPEDYDKHFILTADIDLDPNLPGRKVFDKAVIAPDINDSESWFQGIPFTGLFDGQGHAILRLSIEGASFLGVFGNLKSEAEVKDLGVIDVKVVGSGDCVAGLAGFNSGAVSGCYSTGSISGTHCVGGLLGSSHGAVSACYSVGAVSGNGYVGGLAGSNAGSVVFDAPPATHNIPGGTVFACYSITAVTGSGDYVGGLVGDNLLGNVADCFSTGSVAGGQKYVGGLVGRNGLWISRGGPTSPIVADGSVANCYSIGSVSGSGGVGDLVGYDPSWGFIQFPGIVTASFWDTDNSGRMYSASGGIGKTKDKMQMASTFLEAGWDFVDETDNGTEDIWWILEGKDYPRLWWQLPADDFDDGEPEPLWFVYEVDPDLVRIREVNGRLETLTSAQAQNVDAFYVSDGWRLDVTKEFAIRVDFHFSQQGGGDGRVTLGVIPSLDPSAMKWAELEAGCFDTGPFYLYEVRDRTWVQERVADRFSDGGTLYMSYNPDTDELYFSHSGYGEANAWQTVTGLLKGRWASEPVYVILGGGSDQVILDAGDAYLDNFVVDSGLLDLSAASDDAGTEEP